MPCWTPRAPQAVKTLLTFSFVLYRPHLRETSGSLGDKWFSHVSSHNCSSSCDIYLPQGSPASSAACQPRALFFVLPENLEAIFLPVPFGRSLVSFFGEAWLWLGHPYPFTKSSLVFSCAPACGTFPPAALASSEPGAACQGRRSGGRPDRDADGCPSAVFVSVCTFYESIEPESVEKYTREALWRVVGSCLQPKKQS